MRLLLLPTPDREGIKLDSLFAAVDEDALREARASWNFFIGIKSGLLSDIKYEKQSLPNNR